MPPSTVLTQSRYNQDFYGDRDIDIAQSDPFRGFNPKACLHVTWWFQQGIGVWSSLQHDSLVQETRRRRSPEPSMDRARHANIEIEESRRIALAEWSQDECSWKILDVFCLMNQSSKKQKRSDPGFLAQFESNSPWQSFMTWMHPKMNGSTTTHGFSSQGSEPPENGRED